MIFVKIEELNVRKFNSIVEDISTDDISIIDELESMVIEEIKSYLHNRYDTDLIFSRTNKDRNYMLVRLVIDGILCLLFERVNSNEIPDSLQQRCDKNLEWLKAVAKGDISPDLPKLDVNLEANSYMKYGSNSKFNNVENL
jgi:phage gp36-like protein